MKCSNCSTLNPDDALFCKQCGAVLSTESKFGDTINLSNLTPSASQPHQTKIHTSASQQIEGERKPVTILFADIIGSTSLAEKLDPEEWKEIVTGAHQRVSEAVYRYEGTVAQLLGDGVLAFFGAPITHEDDPIRAVRAGLDIQRSIEEYNQQLKGCIDNFQLRVGISTGLVVVGNVGDDMHMEYLAIGDAVNLAARLQAAAQPGKVLISESTGKLVKAVFELQALGGISLKGKAEVVQAFEVVERKVTPISGRGIEGLVSPLIGREPECAAFERALAALAQGQGHIVAILGEAGVGKTRLIDEFRQARMRHSPDARKLKWLEGRALSYGQTLSFWPMIQLIKNDLGVSDVDLEAKVRAALRQRVNALFGQRAADILPYLAHLIGAKLDEESTQHVRQLDGETLKRQMLWAVNEYFKQVALEQPTALIFEDFHWSDPSTCEALEKLLALTERVPLLLVLPMRKDSEHGSWQLKVRAEINYAQRYTEIDLKTLSAQAANDLVDHLIDAANLPDGIRRLILERSEGNPLYLEEIIRSLIDQKVLVRVGRLWQATQEIAKVQIPETLQGVLLARIDRLPEAVRHTLQLAAVIGKTFLYRLLVAIAAAGSQLDEHLSQLQSADLVYEFTRQPELEYMFKHSLTQEAAYNSVLIKRRKEFHRKVGEALEDLFADRLAEFYGLLAHHFDAAGEHTKAVEYLIKAGDKSRLEDVHAEAIQFYRRALVLLNQVGDLARASRTWLKIGLINQTDFEFEQAYQANETAFALERQLQMSQSQTRGASYLRPEQPRIFRMVGCPIIDTLDPARASDYFNAWICRHLFVGLTEFDADTNVVPLAARSWEVLEGGTRYVFHLRDNIRWTDGTPLTAHDFEWTWKRNLRPDIGLFYASSLNDILGARDYREDRNPDPASVGVRALDPFTLEVRLIRPTAYFLCLTTLPITYPLPQLAVERYADEWWKPEHIVSNGAFRLLELDSAHGVLTRNPGYFGDFPGNLDQFEWRWLGLDNFKDVEQEYQNGRADYARFRQRPGIMAGLPAQQRVKTVPLVTMAMILNPTPPLDDARLRRAIAHALDRERLLRLLSDEPPPGAQGGIVPPGMAGHSPELGLAFDLNRARQLLSEAGYSQANNVPVLKYRYHKYEIQTVRTEVKQQLFEHLGIQIELAEDAQSGRPQPADYHLENLGWAADYPDPDSFLRNSGLIRSLQQTGWHHQRVDQLVDEAAHIPDRPRRLAMYREADRILVNDEAVVVPFSHSAGRSIYYLKPWIKGYKMDANGEVILRDIVIEPH